MGASPPTHECFRPPRPPKTRFARRARAVLVPPAFQLTLAELAAPSRFPRNLDWPAGEWAAAGEAGEAEIRRGDYVTLADLHQRLHGVSW